MRYIWWIEVPISVPEGPRVRPYRNYRQTRLGNFEDLEKSQLAKFRWRGLLECIEKSSSGKFRWRGLLEDLEKSQLAKFRWRGLLEDLEKSQLAKFRWLGLLEDLRKSQLISRITTTVPSVERTLRAKPALSVTWRACLANSPGSRGFRNRFDSLKRVPGALPDLINHFEDKEKTEGKPGEKWQWNLQPLQAFLKSSLPRILKRFPVILFIDALDECGQQSAVELIGYLKQLLRRLPPNTSQFGICFSCRYYPILELEEGSTILLDTENAQDIVTFVQAHPSTNHQDADVGRLIINRAQGVFMWAHLVLK
ncbi:hypothetical protein B0J13DRAFT_664742 [Dactylonectria estremocensis]|uniref:KAP NTPase domain-containing protein n=1 Tax=Dactylonectria estremocensis TaxID=1079267 RepID=A0A9P9EYJ9_9HYPO|nr:hypothetical protein B0J13DRAFT_664742 [Dactylonectria estremocensis]